jgi:hypothetical protein
LVYAPKPCRASFSISFTSEQYLSIKQQTNFEVFSKTHIRELFGDDFDCYKKEIERIKREKAGDLKGIMGANRRIAHDYKSYKEAFIAGHNVTLAAKTGNAMEKARKLHRESMSRKELFAKRNATLKEDARILQEEKDRVIRLFMQKFLWRYLITFYGVSGVILNRLIKGKVNAALKKRNWKAALLIQRRIKRKFNLIEDKPLRTFGTVIHALMTRTKFISPLYYIDAKNTVGTFFRLMRTPCRSIIRMNDFISGIKKMQIRFRNHLFAKKAAIEEMDSVWSREILNLVEKESEFKQMGISYNLDN